MLEPLLRPIRAFGSRFFLQFGIHCATHQIRVLLISSVVISSLLFPAIAIYFSSDTPIFALTLRALDSFITPDDISSWFAHHDLRNLWEGYSDLNVRDDSMARARCGMEGILRSEQVLVHSMSQDENSGTLNTHTLLSTLKLEQRIAEGIAQSGIECLRGSDRRCFSLSPLAFWHHDEGNLMADPNVLETIHTAKNVSVSGVTLTPEMVLAGREGHDIESEEFDTAMFLVLTYLFPDSDCFRKKAHIAWLRVLEEAVGESGDLLMQAQVPQLVALEYNKNNSTASRRSILSTFSYLAYLAFLVYFFRTMRRMDKVHSRIGLAFTGLVEIVVSTFTSLSVCAIVGFRVTMVPWEIFPIVVIFIGVENMFSIVDAVVKTSIALPVKLRVAEGLSRAGTSNTLKLISYNTVLGVIAAFSAGAIRQFCAFAIVVLVAHWFLVHTFFVTVLSIDIQRLELDELLRQDANLTPTAPNDVMDVSSNKPPRSKLARTAQHVYNGRVLKNLSLLLLLAITGTLYYATYPGSTTSRPKQDTRYNLHRLPKPRGASKAAVPEHVSPALHMWQVLNPAGHDLVHVRMESPALLVLYEDSDIGLGKLLADDEADKGAAHRPRRPWFARLWSRTVRPLAWITKIVLVPITVTTALLYGLLLYLLKDADLLEAQRNRAEAETKELEEAVPPVDAQLSFSTLPRAFATDVDLIATSKDGSVVVSIGLQNEFALWKTRTKMWSAIDTSDLALGSGTSSPSAATTLSAVAVDEQGAFCAVGTGAGVIALWYIGGEGVKSLPHLFAEDAVSGVTSIRFAPSTSVGSGQITPRRPSGPSPSSPPPPEVPGGLYATYENGSAIKWTMTPFAAPSFVVPSRASSVTKSFLLPVQGDDRILVGFALEDGTLDIRDVDGPDEQFKEGCVIPAGNPYDLVCKAYVCSVEMESEQRTIVAAATQAGVISLWDCQTSECLHILDEPYGDITRLRLTPGNSKVCSKCGEHPYDNFLLSFSVSQVVLFYRAYLSVPSRRCSCMHNQPNTQLRSSVLIGRRSRSSSGASGSGTLTPSHSHSRSRLSSFSSTSGVSSSSSALDTVAMFPVSGHGVHSRRTSDKDSLRRNLDTYLALEHDDSEPPQPIGPQGTHNHFNNHNLNASYGNVTEGTAGGHFLSSESRSPLWQNLVVTRVGDAICERGGWEVSDRKIVGIRRKPRIPFVSNGRSSHSGNRDAVSSSHVQAPTRSSAGLSPSALERWELWTFNPYDLRLEASSLIALEDRGVKLPSVPPLIPSSSSSSPSKLLAGSPPLKKKTSTDGNLRPFPPSSSSSSSSLSSGVQRVPSLRSNVAITNALNNRAQATIPSNNNPTPTTASTTNAETATNTNTETSRNPTQSVIPRLHFTRVSPFVANSTFCVAGFGNTIGMFTFGSGGGSNVGVGGSTTSPLLRHLKL